MGFKKYPDIERLGHEDNKDLLVHNSDIIIVEEKVDGGNGSFWLDDDGTIHLGSRNRDMTVLNDDKAFAAQQAQLKEHLGRLHRIGTKINPDYIYYIEWMARHTITYTSAPYAIGFDIRLKRIMNAEGEAGFFINREAKETEFERLGIECVPLIWKGTAEELRQKNIMELIPKSKYYDGMAEGICIKNYGRRNPHDNCQLFAKVVREEFKENNRAIFGSMRNPQTDTSKIVTEFCTDARIRKAVLKFVNEDNLPLNLRLMQKVPTYVIKDIIKEEFLTIYDKYDFLDFKEMRQKVPKRCLAVINEMMMGEIK